MLVHKKAHEYVENFEAVNDVLQQSHILQVGRGCEVGVRHGFFSKHLLEQNPELSMWAVDPYMEYMDVLNAFQSQDVQDANRAQAALLLQPFGPRVHWCYLKSVHAAQAFNIGWFDFVFIDAVHEYLSVLEDLGAWCQKVRRGGIVCGHDFSMDGVQSAVLEFAAKYGYDVCKIGPPADVWMIEV